MAHNDSNAVLVAAAVGFVAGMLLAPKSGPETRQQLQLQAEEARQRLKNASDELKKQTGEAKEQLQDGAEKVRRKTVAATDTVKHHADAAKEDLKRDAKV